MVADSARERITMSIAKSWKRIIAWHDSNTVPGKFKLHEGASPSEIDTFEKAIGESLPKDFRESLLLHNGGDCWILWYGELLTLNSILDQWNMYREMQSRGEYAVLGDDGWSADSIDGPIKPVFWNPKRICVTDNSGDHLILDLDPPDDGQRGQIIDHSHEVGPQTILASSWGDFLQKLADDLEAGEYVYVEEEETVALPGMYD